MPKHPIEHGTSTPMFANSAASECAASAQFEDSGDLPIRLASLEAGTNLTSDALPVMTTAHLAASATQRSHSETLTAAHLMYMAELRIAIAEADARAILSMQPTGGATSAIDEESQQRRLALSVWEQEGGAQRRLRGRRQGNPSRVRRRPLFD